MKTLIASSALALLALSAHAGTNLDFDGEITNTCSFLSVNDGALGVSADGKTLGSQEAGGSAGKVQVVTTGDNVVTFSSATLPSKPSGFTGNPTLSIKVGSGIYDTSAQMKAVSYPGDTYTVHAKANSSTAFPAGKYTIRTVMTCAPASIDSDNAVTR